MQFKIMIFKPVSDITRAVVEIEADSKAEALAKAHKLDTSALDFEWHCCSDNHDPIWCEVIE